MAQYYTDKFTMDNGDEVIVVFGEGNFNITNGNKEFNLTSKQFGTPSMIEFVFDEGLNPILKEYHRYILSPNYKHFSED